MLIQLANITKRFRRHDVLKGIDLDIDRVMQQRHAERCPLVDICSLVERSSECVEVLVFNGVVCSAAFHRPTSCHGPTHMRARYVPLCAAG